MITRPRPDLTPAQAAAVEADGGAFVDAGAGSGKTTVLVERYIRAVTDRNLPPSAVLAVTFTNRAAGEMRERIRARLRHDGRDALIPLVEGGWIGTIHATCRRILAEYPEEAGVTRGLRVADEVETVLLRETAYARALASVLDELGDDGMALVAGYGDRLRDVIEALHDGLRIGGHALRAPAGGADVALLDARVQTMRAEAEAMAAKDGDGPQVRAQRQAALDLLDLLARGADAADLADLGAYAKGSAAYKALLADVERTAADIVAAQLHASLGHVLERFAAEYQAAKDDAGALDHDDLQLRTRRLLEEHPAIRDALRERFREIMVDEFQDTDGLQTGIIDLLRAPGTPILAVGDEQQAIYGFRGADVEVFRGERARAEGDERIAVVSLHENRRSVPPVLDAVNALFSREPDFTHRPLVPVRAHDGDEPVVELLVGVADDATAARRVEAALIARRLQALVAAGDCRPGEIAILFQAGTRADAYERALRRVGLPTVASTGRGFLSRQPVEDVLAMLRVLWNRYDDLALLTCLASPMAGVSNDGLALMRASVGYEFADALATVEGAGLREDDLARAVALREAIERLRPLAGRLPLGDLVAAVIAETRYDLASLVLRDGTERMANLAKLERIARAFEDARGPDLPGFIRAIESGRLDTQVRTDGVTASEDDDAIRLLTVHQAKGLEYPVVVVADAGAKPQHDAPVALVGRDGTPAAAVPASTGALQPTAALQALRDDKRAAERQEAHRRAYVACTRAENRLIISGAAPKGAPAAGSTLRWIADLLGDDCAVGRRVVELDGARIAIEAADVDVTPPPAPEPVDETVEFTLDAGEPQLQLDVDAAITANGATPAALPRLAPLPTADAWVAPALSYSALDTFARCPYRFQLQRMLGLPADEAGGSAPVGKAVHAAVETGGDAGDLLLAATPDAEPAQADEARAALDRWRRSPLCARMAGLADVRHEQPFLLAGGPTVVTGFFDLCGRDGTTLVIGDIKVGGLKGRSPEERRDEGYAIQEAVYALAALEAGHAAVEVAFQWVGDDEAATAMATRRFTADDAPRLRADLEARVAEALAGPWPARPSETTCAGCPALGALCAGTGRR